MASILCISHSAELSGATLSLLRVSAYLARNGHDVSIVFPASPPELPSALHRGNTEILVVPNPEYGLTDMGSILKKAAIVTKRIRYIFALRSLIKRSDYDYIYINSAMSLYAGIAARLAGKPIIWHIREDLSPTWGNKIRIRAIKSYAYRVIFVCGAISRIFEPPKPTQTWFFVPNPVDVSQFIIKEPADDLRRKEGLPTLSPVIISVGYVTPRKGFDILLQAFALVITEYPAARLLIVGDYSRTPPAYWNSLQEIIREHNLQKSVAFVGYRDDIPRLLAMSDIFVLSSRNEAMPVCVLEAMAAGKAIVATDVDAINEVLNDGRLGIIVPPEDPQALGSGIMALLRDEQQRATFESLARTQAHMHHEPETIFAQIERIITETPKRS